MKKVKILCDSTCDILISRRINETKFINLPKERDVDYICLNVLINGTSYLDSKDITPEKLFDIVKKTDGKPSTAAISPGMFMEIFKKYVNDGYDVLYISISSHVSGTYNSAVIAKESIEELGNSVHIIDGWNLSSGTGMLVMKACDYRDAGMSVNEIMVKLEEIKSKVMCQFGISTLSYLYRGGRASGLTFFVSKFLHIKPILEVREGKLKAGDKIMGKTEKTIKKQFDMFLEDYKNGLVDTDYVFFTHCIAPDLLKYVEKLFFENKIEVKHLYESHAGSVISAHCGPGTLGIIYLLK